MICKAPHLRPRTLSMILKDIPILLALAVLVSLCSCKSMFTAAGPLQQPSVEFTKASRQFVDAIGPAYSSYVQADPTLSESQKENRAAALSDFEFAVRQVEKAQGVQAWK